MLFLDRVPRLVLVVLVCGGARAELREAQVTLAVARAPEQAAVASRVRVVSGGAGEQYLEATLTNTSGADLTLRGMTVEFPWVPAESEMLIANGGSEMGDKRPRVHAPGDAGIESGAYLMARRTGGCSLAGFVSWKTFWSKLTYRDGKIVVRADGENRLVRAGETVSLEKIWLATDGNWQDLLWRYADEIAHATHAKPRKPVNYVGWGTWDYFGRKFSSDDVTTNLQALLALVPKANLLQIDGGWWPYRGDYTLLRESLPRDAMKQFAALAKARGLTAGIHLDGMRGDLNSAVAKAHPDYFLKDQRGVLLSTPQPNDGDQLIHTYFDFSNPAARDYMRQAVANLRRNWGYDYIKIDFLRFGIAEKILAATRQPGVEREIVPFDLGLTSVERVRLGMQAFREGMGADAYFLGCSAIFGLTFGFCDGLRTGSDVYPEYPQFQRLCVENSGNFYLHGKVIFNDADYHVVRGKEDQDKRLVRNPRKDSALTLNEAAMWSHYVALFGGPKINSDDLPLLREKRRALFRLAASLPACDRYVPVDFWAHGRGESDPPTVLLGEAGRVVHLAVFNWTDAEKSVRLTGMTPADVRALTKIDGAATVEPREEALTIRLPPRHSSIFKIDGEANFDRLRKSLAVE